MGFIWAHENSYLSVQREGGRAHCTLNSTQLRGVFCLSGSCCRLDLSLDRYWVVCARRFQLMDWSGPPLVRCPGLPLLLGIPPILSLWAQSTGTRVNQHEPRILQVLWPGNSTGVQQNKCEIQAYICSAWVQIIFGGNDIKISECPNL